ncbi:E3 ubiquitin-protein ligase TRIM7 [Varanus komodoensis]|uniref:E3 ubiquitin-protein ligase TRIM7-like isoform X2 n=1 Tax=Varanus komodoensis TaxID=61221 RepID=UPI001CF7A3C7|nr:E3 ubiquitin-protein ligase TRIM7-like isoform X2 [Varanus komodoensis]KAF7235280.1 E3 ubiquitin-protein ligase TRIM7 [Varanus komodoensis]
MEDAEGYMSIEPERRNTHLPPIPRKTQVFQIGNVQDDSCPLKSPNSCEWVPGSTTEHVTFDPDTAHPRIVIPQDKKSARWGEVEQSLPNTTKRFDTRVWVLGQKGYNSGKHCWEVEVKGEGEWAVGVAKQSVKRKGPTNFSTDEGIWAVGEYWGKANYLAFTSPNHTRLQLSKKPRNIRVFLDYTQGLVEFFNVETKSALYAFVQASFSGETIYPWFRVWDGTELILHP